MRYGLMEYVFKWPVLSLMLLCMSCGSSAAQSAPEINDIIRSLAPRAGQVLPGGSTTEPSSQQSTPSATERVIIKERVYVVDLVRRLDLEVFFEYDSDRITPKARLILDRLGAALVSEALKGNRFLIAGHTDAVGSDAYNLDLSERRAVSVSRYLIEAFPLQPDQIVSVGFGFRKLRAPGTPRAAVNRRVEISAIVD